MKKVFSLLLAAALIVLTVFPCAAAESVSERYEESGSPYVYWVTDNYDRESAKTRSSAAGLPEIFDLRDVDGVSFVSEIKDQGYTNSCWAFMTFRNVTLSIPLIRICKTVQIRLRQPAAVQTPAEMSFPQRDIFKTGWGRF